MSQGAKSDPHHSQEKVVVAHVAGNTEEAMVIRGLLASAGIDSPGSSSSDPFPMSEPLDASHGVDVLVLESQVSEARQLIAEYVKDNAGSAASDE
ncbi:MAG: hypothetical protein ACRD59_14630 [Candidatus Acidiferrales bacterium]